MDQKLLLSFLTGQAIFWRFGYDQIGLFMRPKVQLGAGQKIAGWAYNRIPPSLTSAWTIKVIEILTDAGKIPIEGAVYKKHGFVPDIVAALVKQPGWSVFETAEKLTGAVLYPKRVANPEQVKVSLGCIYGSVFRYALAGLLWQYGGHLNRAFAYVLVPKKLNSQTNQHQ
jgi:hypothetical protein